ncbi:molybdenum cofactor guanylyltransferase MobA [Fuscibacter oryzae]|uniref:Molybdenum cofactor guanylyltransferase n=1 Tax=Fuscibacter oryzae TaxID=2803939 RepID=A0A8J7MST0_9RHOB|nr:molybdenum cofactor guanylyltransferase MobA [Fuscibacter oryzae]MBL4928285.1 molybdenum cofactor guanylyltransferase MobA [Fuscibacter oryzae]
MLIHGIILAGGAGRRMGGADKALLSLGGRPLISHVIERFAPQVETLALSANGDPARFAGYGLPVLPDDTPLGPLAGILAGLRYAQENGATALVSAPCDSPFLPGDLVPHLCLAAETTSSGLALVQAGGRDQGVFGLWPVALAGALAAFLASGAKPRITDFAGLYGAARAIYADDTAFRNLNTPDDLAAAQALLGGAA